jgi:hypothetical protein
VALIPIQSSTEKKTVSSTAVSLPNAAAGQAARNADFAVIQVLDAPIRWTVDGTTPTTTVGTQAVAGAFIPLPHKGLIHAFQAIREGGTDANLIVQYFTGRPEAGDPISQADPKVGALSVLFADGAVSTPGISFQGDQDTGFYRIGANNVGLALNGVKYADYAAQVQQFVGEHKSSTQLTQTKSANYTMAEADSGYRTYVDTDAVVITLPATTVGMVFEICNSAADAASGVAISPAAADKIMGAGLTSQDNKDLINTKATSKKGDRVKLVADGVNGWFVVEMTGTWAREA